MEPFRSFLHERQAMTSKLTATCALVLTITTAASAQLVYPRAVTAAKDGTVYVVDRGELRKSAPKIWKIRDGKAEVFFEAKKKFRTPLNAPWCAAIDKDGMLLVGDSATRDVYRFDKDGKPKPLTGDGRIGRIGIPMAMAVAADGTIYVADLEVHRIWKVPAAGGKPTEFAVINSPRGLAFDSKQRLWILSTSSKDGQIQRADAKGKLETVVAGRPFNFPHNIVLMDDDTAFVTDNYANTIWKVVGGKPEKLLAGKPMLKPVGLARSGKDLLVADPHAKSVFRIVDGKATPLIKTN